MAGPGRGGRLCPPLALCSPGREPGSGRDGLLRLGPRIWKGNPQPGPRLAAAPRLPRSITQPRVCPACPAPQNHAPGEEAVPGRPEGRREQHGPVPGGQAVGRRAAVLEGPCRPDLPPKSWGQAELPRTFSQLRELRPSCPPFLYGLPPARGRGADGPQGTGSGRARGLGVPGRAGWVPASAQAVGDPESSAVPLPVHGAASAPGPRADSGAR